ncbi:MAG: DUF2339 domain-containing protein [Trichloromonadaceae bacterium]
MLGLLLGGAALEWPGALLGAAVGYLLASQLQLGNKLQQLEQQLQQLARSRPAPQTSAAATPPIASATPPGPPPSKPAVADLAPDRVLSQTQYHPGDLHGSDDFLFESAPAQPSVSHSVKAPSSAPGPPPTPPEPGLLQRFFTGGNLLVKVGVVVLFFGVAFLLKYAAEHTQIPIELRLVAVVLGGCALIALGWRLRTNRSSYAQVLQGGGVGILYLTVFAALRLYQLLPPTLALLVLAAMAALAAALAVLQNAPALALLGATGGFLAPILTSTGSGSHVQLFSYYALLNLGILGVAWFKAWRPLNLIGFAFTFVISGFWGYRYYQPAYFSSVEPFLILFFLFYVAAAVLYALRQPPQLKGLADGTLIFGTPLIATALQAALVQDFDYGMAWSALALGLFYLGLGSTLLRVHGRSLAQLVETFLVLGIIFTSLAIPLAFDGRWTSAAWAVEGAGILWLGVRQARLAPRLLGLLLHLGAGIFFLLDPPAPGLWPLLNTACLGGLLLSASGLLSAFWLTRGQSVLRRSEGSLPLLLLVWGLAWWYITGINEIDQHSNRAWQLGFGLIFCAGSALAQELVGVRLDWRGLRLSALMLLPILGLSLGLTALGGEHPSSHGGWFGWPLAVVAQYLILHWRRELPPWLELQHGATLWLLVFGAAWETSWQLDRLISGAGVWPLLPWGLAPAVAVLLITRVSAKNAWPVERLHRVYLLTAAAPLALAAWGLGLFLNLSSSGNPWPLPYLPLLNPLDISLGIIHGALLGYWLQLRRDDLLSPLSLPPAGFGLLFGLSAWLWLSAVVVRTVHHWGPVPFTQSALYASVLLQAALALTWSLAALATMVWATRRGLRPLWLAGAALLGLVVIKLFLVDLSGTATLARIVSFLGVGSLLLLVGYLAPVPPNQTTQEAP